MEHLNWISPAVIIALLLFVWRELRGQLRSTEQRLDARIDSLQERSDGRIDGVDGRLDELTGEMRAVSERLARLEGAAFGPWPGRRPDPDPDPQTAVRAASDD